MNMQITIIMTMTIIN